MYVYMYVRPVPQDAYIIVYELNQGGGEGRGRGGPAGAQPHIPLRVSFGIPERDPIDKDLYRSNQEEPRILYLIEQGLSLN